MKLTSIYIALSLLLCAAPLCAAESKITFEGKYEYRTDVESQEMLGEQVCFFPTKPSSENVPRPTGDHRLPWFCFTNSKQAAHLFGFALNARSNECGLKGNAKISVSSYKRYSGEGDDNDVATLDAVLVKSKPESLPCSK
jgi:hypothetical protein